MQMIFSTSTGQTEQLPQTLLSAQIVLWDIMMVCCSEGANIVIKRSSHLGCKLEFTDIYISVYNKNIYIHKNIMDLKARRMKPFRELPCFIWMKYPSSTTL